MRRVLVILAAGAVAVTAATGTAAAANPSCMTQREFRAVHKGQTVAQVARIVGSRGHVEASSRAGTYTMQVRSWRTCSPFGAASAVFTNGRLTVKSAVFTG